MNTARDIMSRKLITLDSTVSAMEVAKIMEKNKVSCVVLTKNEKPQGIVTERDLVRKIIAQGMSFSTKIKDIMSSPLIVISPDETVWEIAHLMKQKQIHRVPVLEKDRLVGITSTADLTRLCSIGSDSEMSRICEQILLRMKIS
jgi:CBS domain-containing protein